MNAVFVEAMEALARKMCTNASSREIASQLSKAPLLSPSRDATIYYRKLVQEIPSQFSSLLDHLRKPKLLCTQVTL
jgi:hypothetical protein